MVPFTSHCSNILFTTILLLLGADTALCERKINNTAIITIKKYLVRPQSVHLLLFCKVGFQTCFLSTGNLKTKESKRKDIQTTKQAMRLVHSTYARAPICIWKCRLCRFKLMMFCFCQSIMSCQLLKSGPKWCLSTVTCLNLLFCCEGCDLHTMEPWGILSLYRPCIQGQ